MVCDLGWLYQAQPFHQASPDSQNSLSWRHKRKVLGCWGDSQGALIPEPACGVDHGVCIREPWYSLCCGKVLVQLVCSNLGTTTGKKISSIMSCLRSSCCHYYTYVSRHLCVWPHLMVKSMEIASSLGKLATNSQQRTYVTTTMFPSILKALCVGFLVLYNILQSKGEISAVLRPSILVPDLFHL